MDWETRERIRDLERQVHEHDSYLNRLPIRQGLGGVGGGSVRIQYGRANETANGLLKAKDEPMPPVEIYPPSDPLVDQPQIGVPLVIGEIEVVLYESIPLPDPPSDPPPAWWPPDWPDRIQEALIDPDVTNPRTLPDGTPNEANFKKVTWKIGVAGCILKNAQLIAINGVILVVGVTTTRDKEIP